MPRTIKAEKQEALEEVARQLDSEKQETTRVANFAAEREAELHKKIADLEDQIKTKGHEIGRVKEEAKAKEKEAQEAMRMAGERGIVHLDTYFSRILWTVRLKALGSRETLDQLEEKVSEPWQVRE